jgi:hypothetical protein
MRNALRQAPAVTLTDAAIRKLASEQSDPIVAALLRHALRMRELVRRQQKRLDDISLISRVNSPEALPYDFDESTQTYVFEDPSHG